MIHLATWPSHFLDTCGVWTHHTSMLHAAGVVLVCAESYTFIVRRIHNVLPTRSGGSRGSFGLDELPCSGRIQAWWLKTIAYTTQVLPEPKSLPPDAFVFWALDTSELLLWPGHSPELTALPQTFIWKGAPGKKRGRKGKGERRKVDGSGGNAMRGEGRQKRGRKGGRKRKGSNEPPLQILDPPLNTAALLTQIRSNSLSTEN